jgi:hypothetical protein
MADEGKKIKKIIEYYNNRSFMGYRFMKVHYNEGRLFIGLRINSFEILPGQFQDERIPSELYRGFQQQLGVYFHSYPVISFYKGKERKIPSWQDFNRHMAHRHNHIARANMRWSR